MKEEILMNATACIKAGICGFVTNVSVTGESMFEPAYVRIETNCDKIKKFSQLVQEVSPMNEITVGFDGKIMSSARSALSG